MKHDSKNFILFALFAAIILLGSNFLTQKFFPAANPPATKVVKGKSKALETSVGPAADGALAVRDRAVVLRETAGQRVRIETPKLNGSINLKGAWIDDLTLSQYKETVAKGSPPIRLFSPRGTKDAYYAGFGWPGRSTFDEAV